VCDPLVQAYAVAFAESNRYFTGSLGDLLSLSSDYSDKAVYFDGRSGEAELKIVAFRGLMAGVQSSVPGGSVACGEEAAKGLTPETRLAGMIYIVPIAALGPLGEALKTLLG
jgi:hypothetical protein